MENFVVKQIKLLLVFYPILNSKKNVVNWILIKNRTSDLAFGWTYWVISMKDFARYWIYLFYSSVHHSADRLLSLSQFHSPVTRLKSSIFLASIHDRYYLQLNFSCEQHLKKCYIRNSRTSEYWDFVISNELES